MRIVVLVKEVPDTYGDRKITLETGLVDRGAGESVLDEIVGAAGIGDGKHGDGDADGRRGAQELLRGRSELTAPADFQQCEDRFVRHHVRPASGR